MKEQWRKDMQQKMADYRKAAPEVSWEEMETALAAQGKARTVPGWGRWMAAAAVAALVAGIGWQLLTGQQQAGAPQLAETAGPTIKGPAAQTGSQTETETAGSRPARQPLQARLTAAYTAPARPGTPATHGRGSQQAATATADSPAAEAASDRPATPQPGATSQPPAGAATASPADTPAPNRQPLSNNGSARRNGQHATPGGQQQPIQHPRRPFPPASRQQPGSGLRLTAQAYLSNAMADRRQTTSLTAQMAQANPYGEYSKDMSSTHAFYTSDNMPHIEESVHHSQPVRFGLSLRYRLNGRWSVEGGLAYAYLASDITRKGNGYTYNISQRLSYVSLPVNASYHAWESRHFALYASAGAAVGKMVKGTRSTEGIVNGTAEPATTESVSIRPLQFSLNCAAGAEYKFGSGLSAYAEPGLAYYFDNHSAIPTFYQDKPLAFNLSIGLRLSLGR